MACDISRLASCPLCLGTTLLLLIALRGIDSALPNVNASPCNMYSTFLRVSDSPVLTKVTIVMQIPCSNGAVLLLCGHGYINLHDYLQAKRHEIAGVTQYVVMIHCENNIFSVVKYLIQVGGVLGVT